jgi:hypothetical protein
MVTNDCKYLNQSIFIRLKLIIALLCAYLINVNAQSFFESKNLTVSGSFGMGIIQYYMNHTPVYFGNEEYVSYSHPGTFV